MAGAAAHSMLPFTAPLSGAFGRARARDATGRELHDSLLALWKNVATFRQ